MTCFWDGNIKALFDQFGNRNFMSRPTPHEFVTFLKKYIRKTPNVAWNDKFLTLKELDENYERIKNLNVNDIYNGYDCSSCDPFLFLISELFRVNIIHDFNGSIVRYSCLKSDGITFRFRSNKGHFWKN